jgi:hypothetical protein
VFHSYQSTVVSCNMCYVIWSLLVQRLLTIKFLIFILILNYEWVQLWSYGTHFMHLFAQRSYTNLNTLLWEIWKKYCGQCHSTNKNNIKHKYSLDHQKPIIASIKLSHVTKDLEFTRKRTTMRHTNWLVPWCVSTHWGRHDQDPVKYCFNKDPEIRFTNMMLRTI